MSVPKSHNSPSAALRIALVEDEECVRETVLVPGLRDFGFDVVGVGSAGDLYKCMLSRQFDIVVLDIGLPDDSGINVARHLRQLDANIGLVMLTSSIDRQDRIQSLTGGADVFLPKSIDVDILAVTLRSLARRLSTVIEAPPAAPAEWHLDPTGWCLVAPNGAKIALSAPERSVVNALIEAQGKPVTRDALIETLSDDVHSFDPHRLDMMIYRLRRKLADAGCGQVPLLTSRGAGYLFSGRP